MAVILVEIKFVNGEFNFVQLIEVDVKKSQLLTNKLLINN